MSITQIRYEHSKWYRRQFQIRTRGGGALGKRALHIAKIYSFSSFLIVECYVHVIVVDVNGIKENADQNFPMLQFGHIEFPKTLEKITDLLFGDSGFCHLFKSNLRFKIIPACFQFFQTGFGISGQNTLLDGIKHILNCGIGLL